MKTSKPAIFLALVLVVALSSCGRRSNSPDAAAQAQTKKTQAGLKEETAVKMIESANCQNESPVDQPQEGWKEVKNANLKGVKGVEYRLESVVSNQIVLTADDRVVSASATTSIQAPEDKQELNEDAVTQKIDCRDLPLEKLTLEANNVPLVIEADTGKYKQTLTFATVIAPKDDTKEVKVNDPSTNRSHFNELKTFEGTAKAARDKGEDLIVKYYKNEAGDIEIRTSRLLLADSLKQNNIDAKQMIVNSATVYRAVELEAAVNQPAEQPAQK